jgi:hypothetical protein
LESLTRLVTDSLARHGFDRPVDPRRLQWSHWSRCDSPHSLLVVPSKPGIFAIAEEVAAFCGASEPRSRNPERSEGSPAPDSAAPTRMLAVLQFSEDDDMAFTLDRMFTQANPMRARFATGRCFLRFVVIEDQAQRRSICSALNQWLLSSAEKASGLPADFSSSLELAPVTDRVGRTLPSTSSGQALSANADSISTSTLAADPGPEANFGPPLPQDSGANKNLHCPHSLPSGF